MGKKQIFITVDPTEKIRRPAADDKLVYRIPTCWEQGIQATLSLRKDMLARKATIRRQPVVNATRKSVYALAEPRVGTHSVKLDPNTTVETKFSPKFFAHSPQFFF